MDIRDLREINMMRKELLDKEGEKFPEVERLYLLAFINEIRKGANFTIINKVIEKEKVEEKKSFISFKTKTEEEDIQTEEYIEISSGVDGTYICKAETVKELLGDEYNSLILHLSDEEENVTVNNYKLEAFDETLGIEQPKEVKSAPKKVTPVEESDSKLSRMPVFYYNPEHPDDAPERKTLVSMLCQTHRIKFIANGEEYTAIFAVYPLKITADDPACDIAVSAILTKPGARSILTRGGVSRGVSSTVNIEFDALTFVCHGAWEKGVFNAYIRKTNNEVDIVEDVPGNLIPEAENRTSTTIATIKNVVPGTNLYVLPAIFAENNATGYMAGCVAAEKPDEKKITILSPSTDGSFLVDNFTLEAYWLGKGEKASLYYTLTEE